MAETNKKTKAGSGKAAPEKAKAEKPESASKAKKEEEKAPAHAEEPGAAHGAHAAHGHAPNIREYFVIFAVLAILTVLEVGITKVPGIDRKLMGLALVGLALTKASFVGLYYMHLKHETKVLKLTVALPIAAPTVYALVLISEAAWRLARW